MTAKSRLEATDCKSMISDLRKRVCEFIVAAHHGGAYFTDPALSLDAYVAALEGLQVLEDDAAEREEQEAYEDVQAARAAKAAGSAVAQ